MTSTALPSAKTSVQISTHVQSEICKGELKSSFTLENDPSTIVCWKLLHWPYRTKISLLVYNIFISDCQLCKPPLSYEINARLVPFFHHHYKMCCKLNLGLWQLLCNPQLIIVFTVTCDWPLINISAGIWIRIPFPCPTRLHWLFRAVKKL